MDGFSRLLIEGAFAFDNIWWHEEVNAVVGEWGVVGVLGIVLLIDNMIVEKPRFFAARVGNQRFLLRHFQLEGLSQELSQLVLDFFCFLSWTSKTEERIVCIAHIVKSSIGVIVGVVGAELLELFSQVFGFFSSSLPFLPFIFGFDWCVCRIGSSSFSSRICWNERFFDILIELVQVDITEEW